MVKTSTHIQKSEYQSIIQTQYQILEIQIHLANLKLFLQKCPKSIQSFEIQIYLAIFKLTKIERPRGFSPPHPHYIT